MKFKPGDPVEFDATVRGLFPQEDGDLLIALEIVGGGRRAALDARSLDTPNRDRASLRG